MYYFNPKKVILHSLGLIASRRTARYLKYLTNIVSLDADSKRFRKRLNIPFQILIYHRVLPDFDPFAIDVTPVKYFENQIRLLSSYFKIVTLDAMMQEYYNNNIKPNQICITFDDGYADNYQFAFPILKKYNAPATIFLTTDYISTGCQLWFDRALQIMKNFNIGEVNLSNFNGPILNIGKYQDRSVTIKSLLEWLKTIDSIERDAVLDFMDNKYGGAETNSKVRMLNWDEVIEMSRSGIDFGSHTQSHSILSKISLEQIKTELLNSKQLIEKHIDKKVKAFAYPNGREGDFNNDCFNILDVTGYKYAVTTIPGNNYIHTNPFQLHRISIWDSNPVDFLGRIILNRFMV